MEHKGSENLIPLNKRTPEEVKEITSQGGIASGESKRRRKTFKEIFELLLQDKVVDNPNLTNDELMSLTMIAEANKGNTKAFEIIRDTIGEKPTDKTETKTEVTINDEDKALLNNLYDRLK